MIILVLGLVFLAGYFCVQFAIERAKLKRKFHD